MGRRRGLALIIVVGVLAVLAAVATAFVMMAELERKASQQRLLSTKAYLLARSGIEDALARLAGGQDPDAAANRYRGEDWNDDNVVNAGLELEGQVYRPSPAGSLPDTDLCPLRHAQRPTFFVRDVFGQPDPIPVDGRMRGCSGLLAADHRKGGNHYAVKASTPDGFYVNGGNPSQLVAAGNYNETLRRILGTLAKAIDEEQGGIDGLPVSASDGEALINLRPLTAAGWLSFDQIRTAALGGNQAKLDALRPYLTLKAWVDKRVIKPNGPFGSEGYDPFTWGTYRENHTSNMNLDLGKRCPDFERLPSATIVGRAPVYLGWARTRRPALIALLGGLKGLYLDDTPKGSVGLWLGTPRFATVALDSPWSATDPCHVAATAILGFAGPLDTWQDFNAFCDTIPFTAVSGSPQATSNLRQAMRDTLKANFNPNSDLNTCNPNLSLWKLVDKASVRVYSTEFSLFPIQGRELQSVGRVLSRNGRLLAIRTLRATLGGPKVVRLSTQKEFVCSNLGSLDTPGDETLFRVPGDPTYIALSLGNDYTWGHTRANLQAAGGKGIALQSYPEPCVATGGSGTLPLSINAANYDGNLQLATLETLADYTYLVNAAPNKMMMLAHFDDGFDLDLAASTLVSAKDCQGGSKLVKTAELSNSLWDSTKLSTLYPDGAALEYWRLPAYFDKDSAHGFQGLLSFWFKNSTFLNDGGAPAQSCCYTYVTRSNNLGGAGGTDDTECNWLGYYTNISNGAPYRTGFTHFFALGHGKDGGKEYAFQTPDRLVSDTGQAHRWRLLTDYWDWNAKTEDTTCQLLVNTGAAAIDQATNNYKSSAPGGAEDLTLDEPGPLRHLTILGVRSTEWPGSIISNPPNLRNSDATMDEFVIYDFGTGGGVLGGLSATYASNRYRAGRYYKCAAYYAPGATGSGQAGSWISAPIALPAGSILKGVHWTWYRDAAALPDDYAEIELLDNAGTGSLWPSGSRSGRQDGQSWTVNRILPAGSFRARVHFTRKDATVAVPEGVLPANTPILDSPVFDDLTFVYKPPGGDGFLSWTEGE